MPHSDLLPTQDESELDCVRKFLNVYSPGASLQRASDVFPELKDRGDWDFNITESGTGEWDAVELKSVNFEEFITRINYWEKVWIEVGESSSTIEGFYWLFAPQPLPHPSWPPKHIRKEIESIIQSVCHKILPTMTPGEIIDLGPKIAELTDHWPKKEPRGVSDIPGDLSTYRVVYDPVKFIVSRGIKDTTGKPVMDLTPMSEAFEVDRIDLEKLNDLVVKANRQLIRAKKKGCRRTIMLICDTRGTNPDAFRSALKALPESSMPDIDKIWLVGRDYEHIQRVV